VIDVFKTKANSRLVMVLGFEDFLIICDKLMIIIVGQYFILLLVKTVEAADAQIDFYSYNYIAWF